MNIYCTEINFNLHPLRGNFNPLFLPQISHQLLDVKTFLNPQIGNLLKNLGVYIYIIEAFSQWKYPWTNYIHVDSQGQDIGKINWVFGGKDSYNQWFQIKPGSEGTPSITQANTGSVRYTLDEVDQTLYTYHARNLPFVFQAGIPHCAIPSENPRCCISLVPKWIHNHQSLKYSECVDLFLSYLVADAGLEPTTGAYETPEIPLL